MSSYQYHEFLAIGRPLSAAQLQELREISSRADITTTRFAVEYNYSDLKADAAQLVSKYFDVYVQITSWGQRRLILRLPADDDVVEAAAASQLDCAAGESEGSGHILVDLCSRTEEYDGWVEDEGWMIRLAGARELVMQGDLRALYLGWLLGVLGDECSGHEDDEREPEVPAGLGELPPTLKDMADFLRLDDHLLEAAAEASAPTTLPSTGLEQWVAALPTDEKDALLFEVASGGHVGVATRLVRRFRRQTSGNKTAAGRPRRTVGELRERAEQLENAHKEREELRRAEERRRQQVAAEAAKQERLARLSGRVAETWVEVDELVASKDQNAYDTAVVTLLDLRAIATRDGRLRNFTNELSALHERHRRKPSFVARLGKAGLLKTTR